jgi:hypothetical protein
MPKRKRGRPAVSVIRQNIVEIVYFLGAAHAYQIFKVYQTIFPKASMRSIYYHLKKGLTTGEFVIAKIEKVKGDFSWGPEVQRTLYKLSGKAKPKIDKRIKEYLDKQK